MDKTTLTPEESLLLISKTIEETKNRFKESGHIIIFWGILMFIVPISQYILIQLEYYKIHWYPYFLYPLGGIYTAIFVWREYMKKNRPRTIIGNIVGAMGWSFGLNFMILGFFFSQKIGEAITPIFLIFMAFFVFFIGIAIKFKPLIIGGLLLYMIGLITFYVDLQYQFFMMPLGALVALIIPGILLSISKTKGHV